MRIIDAHTHAFPEGLASRAVARVETMADWQAVGDGTLGGLLGSMDSAGVDTSVVCMIATKPDQVEDIFQWCLAVRSERICPFPSVHPETPDAAGWLRRFADAGLAGIKLHAMHQDFTVDDARMDGIYAAAAECGLVVAFHSGLDFAFPDDDRASPERLRRVLDRHGRLRMLGTHLGGWRVWDDVERHLVGTGALLETSFSVQLLGARRMADIIRRHGPEKVLFGTDWPWQMQDEQVSRIRKLALGEAELRGILGGNAARELGI